MRRIPLSTGVTLAVQESGRGAPVVLLHAWGETHRSFDRLVPLLPGDLRLVVPDLRGVGESDKPDGGYSVEDAAGDVVALLDELGLHDGWLLGTSSGGYLAQQVAVQHPERVRGLVLVGAPSDLRGQVPRALAGELAAFHDPVTPDDIRAVNQALPLHAPVPDGFLADQADAALTIPRAVWLAGIEGLVTAEPPLRRGTIVAPALVLWGAEDDILPETQAHELAAAIGGSRLVIYEATGHLVLWERPGRVAEDAAAFIAAHEGGSPP
ncbi:alpha/beta fold hydrolase [Leifsonia shinshuensis]|uniref:Alpha/beta fold hydrolase n=1 Tax=Leifsonia shinshuensis TaxID=150026 RepID=A0A7G6Y7Z4_9MICO|nr:alpha/beta hydrolase [Leifsonia shinshuensis]QNE34609.1 alpha/beta fold hydrolase [Leifsonia shinshuensis]